jgi:tRNA G18 (ribose-2'-O)-methylase SpoU
MVEIGKDTRNVIDYYKEWENDQIKADLDTRRLPFVVGFENISGDFNKASGIRNSNAFLAKESWIIGKRQWDRRGAVGTHNYIHLKYAPSLDHIYLNESHIRDMRWVAVDNVPGAIPLTQYEWRPNTFMIFGEEARGVSPMGLGMADDVVMIPQLGSVRSLNVSVASGIMMYDYATKLRML